MSKVSIDSLQPLTRRDLTLLQEWFEDAEVHKRLEGMLPLLEWYGHVEQHPGYGVWVAFSNNKAVGIIMIEQEEDNTGSIAIVVDPLARGKGYGKNIISRAMNLPELERIQKWYAGIEADNTACLKCFESAGFTLEHAVPDEDGYYSLWYIME